MIPKIVLMRSGSVGKSAIEIQFVKGIFVQKYNSTIRDEKKKKKSFLNLFYPNNINFISKLIR